MFRRRIKCPNCQARVKLTRRGRPEGHWAKKRPLLGDDPLRCIGPFYSLPELEELVKGRAR